MHAASPLALLVLLAPTAWAHAVPADFRVEPFAEPLPFEGERSARLVFDHRCSGMSGAASEPGMRVTFTILQHPAWARLRIENATQELAECQGVGQATARLVGSADPDAISLEEGVALVQAEWLTSGFSLNSTAEVKLRVPFVAAFEMEVPMREVEAKPQSVVTFPVTFVSRATGPMKLAFERIGESSRLNAPPPPPVTLQGPGGAHRTATVPFIVQTPFENGPMDEVGTVTYRITPHAALDPSHRGEPQEITFTVRTTGFYVPGANAAAALLALGSLAALLARRER